MYWTRERRGRCGYARPMLLVELCMYCVACNTQANASLMLPLPISPLPLPLSVQFGRPHPDQTFTSDSFRVSPPSSSASYTIRHTPASKRGETKRIRFVLVTELLRRTG
ncbi:hypothetical protein GGS24DRAFT_452077 [Hypoxylon argillaceum]|nr:hypothetical protein GGS24DRAFT_452077 [Hypoxylon argillaceum]